MPEPRIRAVACDVDGTLLDSQARLSRANVEALRRCAEKGIALYIATVRPKRLVFRPEEADADAAFIAESGAFMNGAVAIDGPLRHRRTVVMEADTVRQVVSFLGETAPEANVAIQTDEYYAFRFPIEDTWLPDWGITREELIPFEEASERECLKLVAWLPSGSMADICVGLRRRLDGRANIFHTDWAGWMQVLAPEASKENALLHLTSLRGIRPEEVACFGDDTPDIGMLRTFGYSVAMGNASEQVKKSAKYTTTTNDQDGVAHALRHILGVA